MDDGVQLRAGVVYPTEPTTGERMPGPFPVVIEHSVYPESVGFSSEPVNTYLAEYGYISVHVNSRGTGGSDGVGQFISPREGRDGAAIVDWAAHELTGSDGRVAAVGCSFPAMQAYADAAAVGPNSPLKAAVAACAALGTTQRMDIMVSGVPTGDFGWLRSAANGLMDANQPTREWYAAFAEEVLAGGDAAYEREFWRDRIPIDDAQQIVDNQVPVLMWTGWDDIVGVGALRTYTALQNAFAGRPLYAAMAPDQPASPRYQLIVGNWGHAGGLDQAVVLQWLETWVKGVDTGMQDEPTPLKLAETGTGRWVGATAYPLVDRATVHSLRGDGTLDVGRPAASAATDSTEVTWGDSGSNVSFTGPPMAEPTTLSGPVGASLTVTTDSANLQIAAQLLDVGPGGAAREITHGSIVGSLRELDQEGTWRDAVGTPIWPWQTLRGDTYLTPGEATRIDVAFEPRQWALAPGHRLRLELSSRAGADLTAPQQVDIPGSSYRIRFGESTLNVPLAPTATFTEIGCRVTPTSGATCIPG